METIIRRTKEYTRKGIYVLRLLPWTLYLDGICYSPRLWEKWIHASYFGRVDYGTEGLSVSSYHFDPYYENVPENSWYSPKGKRMNSKAYKRQSKRYRTPVRGKKFNLVEDFSPKAREAWEANGFLVPAATLFMERSMLG